MGMVKTPIVKGMMMMGSRLVHKDRKIYMESPCYVEWEPV